MAKLFKTGHVATHVEFALAKLLRHSASLFPQRCVVGQSYDDGGSGIDIKIRYNPNFGRIVALEKFWHAACIVKAHDRKAPQGTVDGNIGKRIDSGAYEQHVG
jgi:hypothetical protein